MSKKFTVGTILENGVMLDVIQIGKKYKFVAQNPNGEISIVDTYQDEDIQYLPMDLAEAGIATAIPNSFEKDISPLILLDQNKQHIKKYIDVTDYQAEVMARYAMVTWTKDKFNFTPLLRLQGAPGSGKSTTLRVLASICYKSYIFGAAVTPATIFRKQEEIRGTLLVDEFNKFDTSMTSDFAQIFNAGCDRDYTIPRCDQKSYKPRDYHVGGPKIVACRSFFDDGATETRCININLFESNKQDLAYAGDQVSIDARLLTSQLFGFRLQHLKSINPGSRILGLEKYNGRFRDVFSPLFQVTGETNIGNLKPFIQEASDTLEENLYLSEDKCVAIVTLRGIQDKGLVGCLDISRTLTSQYGLQMHPRRIGSVLRTIGIKTRKTSAANVVDNTPENIEKLKRIVGESEE